MPSRPSIFLVLLSFWAVVVPLVSSAPPSYCKTLSAAQLQDVAGLTSIDQIMEDVESLAVVRVPDTPSHAFVRTWIAQRFLAAWWDLEQTPFVATTPHGNKTFQNLVATFLPRAGSGSRREDLDTRFIVLAAHYDSKWFKEPNRFVAAIDSAVPCALLLDLVRSLEDRFQKTKLRLGVKIVFFDGEEAFDTWTDADSLYGSRHLAGLWEANGRLLKMEMLLLLDLLGTESPEMHSFHAVTDAPYNRLINIETRLRSASLIPILKRPVFLKPPFFHATMSDDHTPFLKRNIACLHLIPARFPDTWHTENDDLRSLHPPTIAALATILRVFVIEYLGLV